MKQEPAGENTFRSTLGVLAGIAGAIALAAAFNTFLSAGKAPRDLVDEQFDDSASGMVIRARFAADYEAALAAIPADHMPGLNERFRQSDEIIAGILSKYGRFAGRAPDADLRDVIAARVDLLRHVRDKKDTLACARLLKEGSDFLMPVPRHIADKMDAVFAALMTSIADGRDNPVSRKAVYVEDWAALNAAVRATGVDQNHLDALEDDSVHAQDCATAIAYYDTLSTFPGEAGERARSYAVDAMASLT